ncbi:MAG: flavoprotein [Wenzhouxiangella sp.]
MSKADILLAVSGSIAAFKAASLTSMLVQNGYDVQVVLTPGGRHFIGAATFEGLTGREVRCDLFAAGQAMDHIQLVDWADLVLVYPCSASMLAKLRAGRAEDLTSSLFLANNFRKPWWLAPAMNSNMFAHPAVVENLETLTGWGCRLLPPAAGRMACGDRGPGRLIEPQDAAAAVMEAFS